MNINRLIDVSISTNSLKDIKLIKSLNINIYDIKYLDKSIIITINVDDFDKVSDFFNCNICNKHGFNYYIDKFKNNIFIYLPLFIIILFINIISNFIIDIKVYCSDIELKNYIINELDKNNINKFQFKHDDNYIFDLSNNILENNRDKLEWINIKRVGMTYEIRFVPKVSKEINNNYSYCNIIAKRDGVIKRIITTKGVELKDINDSVSKGDVIVSGDIVYNEESKSHVCADGVVMANTWYQIDLTVPKYYEEKVYEDKSKLNLIFKHNNKTKKLFKHNEYDNDEKRLFNFFGVDIYYSKDRKYYYETYKYTEDEINNLIDSLIDKYVNENLSIKSSIVERKVLKKEENDSKIYLVIFIVVLEDIGEIEYLE